MKKTWPVLAFFLAIVIFPACDSLIFEPETFCTDAPKHQVVLYEGYQVFTPSFKDDTMCNMISPEGAEASGGGEFKFAVGVACEGVPKVYSDFVRNTGAPVTIYGTSKQKDCAWTIVMNFPGGREYEISKKNINVSEGES